jgi:L-alanine-DL-glutamate epimerase-like enolase superfamily enzyme
LIELETDQGLVGIGESSVMHRPAEATLALLDAVRDYIVGEDPFQTERIAKKLHSLGGWHFSRGFGNRFLSGIEMALWDLVGKACQQPLYKLLGGAFRKEIPVIKVLLEDRPEVMADVAREAVEAGYETLYLKYTSIDALMERLEAIRRAVGDGPQLRIDFNATLSPGFAIHFINRELAAYNIEFIEQPVGAANLEGLAHVRRSVNVPIAADESCQNMYQAFNVIRHEAADIIHINPRMHDGLWDVKKTAGMAEAAGLPVVAQSLVEGGAAQALFLHVIASTSNFILANQCVYDNLADDYIETRLPLAQGHMHLPEQPGLGVHLDRNKVEQFREHFHEAGTYSVFSTDPQVLPTIPVPTLPRS